MKNIMKYMLVALTTLSFSVAQAGDLSITGDAKASYVSHQVILDLCFTTRKRSWCF